MANPTTEATGGKIRFKAGEEEGKFLEKYIDIPKYSEEMQILDEIKAEDFDKINAGFEISFSGLENGVLVDKEANKVYKAEKVLDETEEKATEINFTAGPIITTDENFINNKDYIKVTFNKGEHGKIYENKEAAEEKDSIDFYLYRGIKLEGLLENLVRVKAELPYEFKGRDPELKGSYDAETSHTALYKIADLIPQSGNDKPEGTPKNYVKVEFKAGEGGSFEEGQTTIFWVNPEAEVEIPEPKVKANEGYKFKAWSKELKGKFDKETEITAQFEKTGEQNPEDKLYISYEKKDLLSNGLEQDSGIVIKNLNDKTKITVRYRNGRIPEYRIDEEGRLFVTPGKDVKGPITVIIEDERLEEGKKTFVLPLNKDTLADVIDPSIPDPTEVEDINKLTDKEKEEVRKKIFAANSEKFPDGTEVVISDDGSASINYPDGTTDKIPGTSLVKKKGESGSSDKDSNGSNGSNDNSDKGNNESNKKDNEKYPAVIPQDKVTVVDKNKLSDQEKKDIIEKIKKVNPEVQEVKLDDKGNATLTYKDGSTNTIDASKLIVEKEKPRKISQVEKKEEKKNKQAGGTVRTGVGSVAGVFGVLAAAGAGLFASKKRK